MPETNQITKYIGLIILYNNNPMPINKIGKNYLIGTNILVNKDYEILKIPIDENPLKHIKYKTVIRKYCRKHLKINLKNIIRIKHLNNISNFHNYLVIIKPNKYLQSLTNIICSTGDRPMYWRTFYDTYSHTQEPFNLREVYRTFMVSPTKLKINASIYIKIENIYPLLAEYYI